PSGKELVSDPYSRLRPFFCIAKIIGFGAEAWLEGIVRIRYGPTSSSCHGSMDVRVSCAGASSSIATLILAIDLVLPSRIAWTETRLANHWRGFAFCAAQDAARAAACKG